MKRLTLILGALAVTAIAAPVSASAQIGCTWWDLTCNGYASAVTGYGWHMIGRDQAGNVLYFRRLVDSNGNVVFDEARRDNYGRYVVVNNHTLRRGTVYGPNGEICKYSSNKNGYKEDCKYAHALTGRAVRYEPPKVKPVHYEAPKVHTIKYKAPKVRHVDYEAPKVNHVVDYKAPHVEAVHNGHVDAKAAKAPEGKDETKGVKGPKH